MLAITEARLQSLEAVSKAGGDMLIKEEIYSNGASHAEALVGLARISIDEPHDSIKRHALADWMIATTLNRMKKLVQLRSAGSNG